MPLLYYRDNGLALLIKNKYLQAYQLTRLSFLLIDKLKHWILFIFRIISLFDYEKINYK